MKDHANDTDDYPEKIDDNDAEMVQLKSNAVG